MKSKIIPIIVAAVCGAALAACSGEDNVPEPGAGKSSPVFTATIGDTHSRALDSSWEAGDEIGISGAGSANVCYLTKDGAGKFSVKTPGTEIYFLDDEEVTFTAYYPWSALTAAPSVSADTRMQASQKSFDFLWAQASGKKAAPEVAFAFAHRMTKIALTVKAGNGVDLEAVNSAAMSLAGFRVTGAFSTADGSTATEAAAPEWEFAGNENAAYNSPVTISDAQSAATYSLIFFPQLLDAPLPFTAVLPGGHILKAEIDFTAANSGKDGDAARNEWVAGRQYNLTVTLNKTGISLDGCTIIPWNEVSGGNIDADQNFGN